MDFIKENETPGSEEEDEAFVDDGESHDFKSQHTEAKAEHTAKKK